VVSGTFSAAAPSWRSPLRRIEWLLDRSALGQSTQTAYIRMLLGSLFLVYGVVLGVLQYRNDTLGPKPVFIVVFALFLFTNRVGSSIRYLLPIALAIYAYGAASSYAGELKLGVHYKPQMEIDRALTLGHGLPTVWLQQHLYDGRTGPLEAIAVIAYAGHFLVPFLLVAALIITRKSQSIPLLVFALMTTSILGDLVFVLAPTAPPWLAEQQGYITGVHHILKQSLAHMHMSTLAAVEGDASKYDITAAMPSLHTAFAVVALLVARRAGMSRFSIGLLALNVVAVVFSIVYTGEHYVSDALAGALLAVVSWRIVIALAARRSAEAPAELQSA
jgi:membrane-associated phospholipid phosphatase